KPTGSSSQGEGRPAAHGPAPFSVRIAWLLRSIAVLLARRSEHQNTHASGIRRQCARTNWTIEHQNSFPSLYISMVTMQRTGVAHQHRNNNANERGVPGVIEGLVCISGCSGFSGGTDRLRRPGGDFLPGGGRCRYFYRDAVVVDMGHIDRAGHHGHLSELEIQDANC